MHVACLTEIGATRFLCGGRSTDEEARMALSKSALAGVSCALVTPVDAQGAVDRAAVRRLVDSLLAAGIDGLVPVGGTGEYPALSPLARREMVEATVAAAAGRVPVVAGVLAPGFADAVQAGREFKAAGADGLLLITPYYTPPTQSGIRQYFDAYLRAVGLPLLLYEIPARTGIAVAAETIAAMAEDGSIIGMKSCNPDLGQFIRVLALAADRIAILSGEEPFFASQVGMGAAGGILATANLVPRLWKQIYMLASGGDLRGALERQAELQPLLAAIFAETNPGPLKAAMAMADLPVGYPLLPLSPPARDTLARLQAVVPPALLRERAAAQSGPNAAR